MTVQITVQLGDPLGLRLACQEDHLRVGSSGRAGLAVDRIVHDERLHDAERGVIAGREPGDLEAIRTRVQDLLHLGPTSRVRAGSPSTP